MMSYLIGTYLKTFSQILTYIGSLLFK